MLTVRNSLVGETIFGQVQESEHKIEYNETRRDNKAWNLFADKCLYIDLNENPEESESDTSDDDVYLTCTESDYSETTDEESESNTSNDEELSSAESESTDDLNLKPRKRFRSDPWFICWIFIILYKIVQLFIFEFVEALIANKS